MTMSTQRAVGAESIDYIRKTLMKGNSLSRQLLSRPLEQGGCTALVPPSASAESVSRFDVGGVTDRKFTEAHIVGLVSSYLATSTDRYAVFEHALARAGEPVPAALRDNYFTVNSEVYFFVPSAKFNDSLIRDVVRTTTTQLFTGALTRLEGSEIIARQPASTSLIKELADNSELILIGAYDGEAVLIWSPQPVSITE